MHTLILHLTPGELKRLWHLSNVDDTGPPRSGWQSPTMEVLGKKIRQAVEAAEVKPVEIGGEAGTA